MEASSSILSLHASSPSSLRLPWKPLASFSLPLPTLTRSIPSTSISIPRLCSLSTLPSRSRFVLRAAVDVITLQEDPTTSTEDPNSDPNLAKRKLYVVNLPWTYPSTSIRDMFAEFGPVTQIEMIKDNKGRFKGYAFVTMATPEAALAAIDKLNSTEIEERVIKVEYAKALKPQSSFSEAVHETPHKLYVSNLQWKVRSNNLRDFFSPDFNPVSARVVFESSPRRSAGYGFVSFATREEADAAVASLNGKDLMGRPIMLKISEVKSKESRGEAEDEGNSEVNANDQQNEVSE